MKVTYVAKQQVTYPSGWVGPWNELDEADTLPGAREKIEKNKIILSQVGGFEKHHVGYRIVRREETVVEEDCGEG